MVKIITKIKKAVKRPSLIIQYILSLKCVSKCIPDKLFLKVKFRLTLNKKLNLKNPQTFNEKLQWLKLYDRNPEHTMMVDKYKVREYISDVLGEEYLIPLLGVWDNPDDIDFEKLPEQFVLKCNHNSGVGMYICKDKSELDIAKVKGELKKGLRENYFLRNREWPYKNVDRKIIAEKFMVDESGTELKDYKFFCFDGEPEYLFIATDRHTDTKFDFYNMDFEHLPFTNGHENANRELKRPIGFDTMVECARKLSKGLKHARIDFYDINGRVYFGEITFFHWSGFVPFEPEEWDYEFGKKINL